MIDAVLEQLAGLSDARTFEGCALDQLDAAERAAQVILPTSHREFLSKSDGATAFGGHFRIFGAQSAAPASLLAWNADECWKFAWAGRSSAFWCFAETAWGDQYAYAADALVEGADPTVYLLDGLSMTPQKIADNFTGFLSDEFLRSAKAPYDAMIVGARQRFGDLPDGAHLIYTPSILLGADETLANVSVMNARAAMICNGDIAVQLDAGPPDGVVTAVETYTDDLQRMRLRLAWA